jgi:tRNA-dihydrouridine synthase
MFASTLEELSDALLQVSVKVRQGKDLEEEKNFSRVMPS